MRPQIAFRHDWGRDVRFLIARVTGAPVHCCTLYSDAVFDVGFRGMRHMTRAQRFAAGRWELLTPPSDVHAAAGRGLAAQRVGWHYDWIGCLSAWWLGRVAGNAAARKVFCSEQGAGEVRAWGVPLLYNRDARYTPRQLRDELVNVHGFTSEWVTP